MENDYSTLERLNDQQEWYSSKSAWNQNWFKKLKLIEIISAALIPFIAGIGASPFITGLLGIIVVVLEGIQNLYQFQSNWISYRSTAEGLKHEKCLWLAKSGPYLRSDNPDVLFAERVESLISTEHAKWLPVTEQIGKQKKIENC